MEERRYHLRRTEDQLLVQRLATMASQSFAVIEEERARIARELHDELGGVLTVVKMDLAWLLRHLPRHRNDIHERVERASQDVYALMTAVQRICNDLHPPILDKLDLAEALRWQAGDFMERTDIPCVLNIGDVPQLKRNATIAIFRVFQEALTNVARHAHATQIRVDLLQDQGAVLLRVQDNGIGIEAPRVSDPSSLGLWSMKQRVEAFHGTFSISGEDGSGTTVIARIPLSQRNGDSR